MNQVSHVGSDLSKLLTLLSDFAPPAESRLVREWLYSQRFLHRRLVEQFWTVYLSQLHSKPCSYAYDISCFWKGEDGQKRRCDGEGVEHLWAAKTIVKAKL